MTVYEIVTERILKQLENGTVPWRQPWIDGFPRSLVTGKRYRGINVFLLSGHRYPSSYWLTYKQARQLGGYVRKGEKGTPIVFWTTRRVEEPAERKSGKETGERKVKTFSILRYYLVFNVAQCEGISEPDFPHGIRADPIEVCDLVVRDYPNPPKIEHGEPRAYYRPLQDLINMPGRMRFESAEEYYSTLFHELIHSTGHSCRLDRKWEKGSYVFGSEDYSKEELIAEMGAAFLCGHAGIANRTIDNSAAYLASWLKVLRDDRKLLIPAAGAAQKAADYVLRARPACNLSSSLAIAAQRDQDPAAAFSRWAA